MYYINSSAQKAFENKGFAKFPEDFQRLKPGEVFTMWKNGNDYEIETILEDASIICEKAKNYIGGTEN